MWNLFTTGKLKIKMASVLQSTIISAKEKLNSIKIAVDRVCGRRIGGEGEGEEGEAGGIRPASPPSSGPDPPTRRESMSSAVLATMVNTEEKNL